MAVKTNFQALNDITVYVGAETTFGTAAAATAYTEFQVLDYTFSYPSPALEAAPPRAGSAVQSDGQFKHRPELELYTASTTIRGTVAAVEMACGAFFGSGSSPCVLPGSYAPPHSAWKDSIGSTTQKTLVFEGAGSDTTKNDIKMISCIPVRLKIMEDVGSNNGMMVVEIDWVSAYKPIEEAVTITSPTRNSGAPKYIQNMNAAACTVASNELVLWSWDLELTRTLQRVSYIDTTDYDPYGMVQVGEIEVTANLSAKNDDSVNDLAATFYSDTAVALALTHTTAAELTISCPKVFIDKTSIEKGDGIQMVTLPLRVASDETTPATNMLSITIS